MARLYFRGSTATAIGAHFQREGELTGKRALRHMRKVSKLIMEQSIRNSPVDWKGPGGDGPRHELERSHKLREEYGAGRRLEAFVEVGGMVGSVDVDLYAEWLHNGSYRLGKASLAKMKSDSRNKVGPEYLERALQDHEDDFEPLLDELMDGLLGGF